MDGGVTIFPSLKRGDNSKKKKYQIYKSHYFSRTQKHSLTLVKIDNGIV